MFAISEKQKGQVKGILLLLGCPWKKEISDSLVAEIITLTIFQISGALGLKKGPLMSSQP